MIKLILIYHAIYEIVQLFVYLFVLSAFLCIKDFILILQ